MPCSRSGHSYPVPAPPHALMNLPALSNTMTGGAAIAASSGLSSVLGRCRSQTLSFASTVKLDTSPSFHFAGTFGHARSTSNIGRLRALDWAASDAQAFHFEPPTIAITPTRTARLIFVRFIVPSVATFRERQSRIQLVGDGASYRATHYAMFTLCIGLYGSRLNRYDAKPDVV